MAAMAALAALAAMVVVGSHATLSPSATLFNTHLPVDQRGEKLITGEASALLHDGAYYFYFNNWDNNSAPGTNCCNTTEGCASCCATGASSPYQKNHTVQVYRTTDFTQWENLGVALPLSSRAPGVEFRPCVVYNAKTDLFVMWYENRAPGLHGYAVATSKTPQGPFITTHHNVDMPDEGKIGDFNLFIDDDGKAYHVRTGFEIVELDADYTAPARHRSSFSTPKRSEGPTMFKRNGIYYITSGTVCCACIGGSSIYVMTSSSVDGPWDYRGDVGSVPGHAYDPHSPNNYVTKAQGSAAFTVGEQVVYLGNQWNSGLREDPPGPRNHDLLYWTVFNFGSDGAIKQVVWEDEVTLFL